MSFHEERFLLFRNFELVKKNKKLVETVFRIVPMIKTTKVFSFTYSYWDTENDLGKL
jgi:hypothetical protein